MKTHVARMVLAATVVLAVLLGACQGPGQAVTSGPLKVLGVENFYADIAAQIGGDRVKASTILSDPGIAPHLYESSVDNAKLVATANIIIKNGLGYDAFVDKLIAASPRAGRVVLDVGQLSGRRDGDNPHLWYDTFAMTNALLPALVDALAGLDPAGRAAYAERAQSFRTSLQPVQALLTTIRERHPRATIMATEPLWDYQAELAGLTIPDSARQVQLATEEGIDPPAQAVARFRDELTSRRARLLVYNVQAETPIAQQMRQLAAANAIPVVPMTETAPPGVAYQQWMTSQLQSILQALG